MSPATAAVLAAAGLLAWLTGATLPIALQAWQTRHRNRRDAARYQHGGTDA